jgi:hypothetical protein
MQCRQRFVRAFGRFRSVPGYASLQYPNGHAMIQFRSSALLAVEALTMGFNPKKQRIIAPWSEHAETQYIPGCIYATNTMMSTLYLILVAELVQTTRSPASVSSSLCHP